MQTNSTVQNITLTIPKTQNENCVEVLFERKKKPQGSLLKSDVEKKKFLFQNSKPFSNSCSSLEIPEKTLWRRKSFSVLKNNSKEERIEFLKNRIKTKDEDIKKMVEYGLTLKEKIEKLHNQIYKMKKKVGKRNEIISTLNQLNQKLESENDELCYLFKKEKENSIVSEIEQESKENQIEELEKSNTRLSEREKVLKRKVNDLKLSLEKRNKVIDDLRDVTNKLKIKLSFKNKKISEIKTESKGEGEGCSSDTEVLNKKEEKKVQNRSLKFCRQLSFIKHNLEKTKNEKERDFIVYKHKINQLKKQINDLKTQLDDGIRGKEFKKTIQKHYFAAKELKKENLELRNEIIEQCNFIDTGFRDIKTKIKTLINANILKTFVDSKVKKKMMTEDDLEMFRAKVQLETLIEFGVVDK